MHSKYSPEKENISRLINGKEKNMTEKDYKEKIDSLGWSIDSDLVHRLYNMGFFDAPASTKFHGNYPGGLFEHSFEVAKQLVLLTEKEGLKWEQPRSPYIIGLLHDLCKVDQYDVLFDGTITWNKFQTIKGHGDKSVILCADLLALTEEEKACIRWHMGAFDEKDNWKHFTDAIHKYPNVLWTHTADMIASHIVGV